MKPGPELDALIAAKIEGPLRHYSTDIACAWEVAEKLRIAVVLAMECWSDVDIGSDPERLGWAAAAEQVAHVEKGDKTVSVELYAEWSIGETAPHAICLAALVPQS